MPFGRNEAEKRKHLGADQNSGIEMQAEQWVICNGVVWNLDFDFFSYPWSTFFNVTM